ncbi:MAG TPA: DUF4159 domain-containing protein [Saprospiraceae bacterium]|nr:DUF4159 domain-containing protein [Saprospiraceae bacterium]HMQ83174.1 DUF4159 domain-containing protein [Saprospiraceae bacterium]
MKNTIFLFGLLLVFGSSSWMDEGAPLQMGLLKYRGGGDWYANPTALPNLAAFCNQQLGTNFDLEYAEVEVGSADLFNYAFIHMTGHGNVVFSDAEADNLRNYLMAGGFLHIDDNYGIDPYVRVAMKQVFPELEFTELPFEHEIYHQKYEFKRGLPKIHKHDDKSPQGFGLFWEGRLVCFYSYECDLGDGWEDPEVHNDPPDVRLQALQMGANIIQFAFEQ